MSIILSNGVTLPDIPSEVLAEYPFATIYSLGNDNEVVGYFLYAATSIFGHVNKGVMPSDNGEYELVGSMTNGTMRLYSSSTTGWYVGAKDELSAGSVVVPVSEVQLTNGTIAKYTLVWSNHDILNITSIDMETGEYRTGDVYFWKSGEENVTLPPIPAELKNRYGFYAIVRRTNPIDTRYFVAGAPTPGAYVTPEQVGENYGALFCKSKTGYITYKYVVGKSTDWELIENPPHGNGWCMVGTDGIFTMVITDANADIYYAATYDPDTEDITYSSEVYFAKTISDEVGKPTRVSIGRSLMNGYAKEVQRLTGTTDQMNAVQIQEKLSAVKAGIKIGDVVLPAFPESWNDTFIAVCYLSNEETPYVALAGDGELLHFSQDDYGIIGTKGNGIVIAQCTPGAAEWEMKTISYEGYQYPKYTGSGICWSNHDIYEITSINEDTGEFTTGDVYCLTSQNFNGVWLPKIPEDVLASYPYAVMLKCDHVAQAIYQAFVSESSIFYASPDLFGSECVGSMGAGGSFMCGEGAHYWSTFNEFAKGDAVIPIGESNLDYSDFTKVTVVWANHDIDVITSLDLTTGEYTTGGLYFPPLSAIDSDRVSIGYDLFNDIVEQIQRLSNNEEKMDALRAYWKLTTVAAVVTVTDDNTNSGIVIDGVSFPDLPEVNFPYAFIAYHTAGYYYLQYSREPYYADYWKTNSTTANPYYKYSSTSVYYDENDGRIFRLPSAGIGVESIWADYTNESSGMALISYNNKNTQVVWSNYDIYFNYPDNTIAFHSSV